MDSVEKSFSLIIPCSKTSVLVVINSLADNIFPREKLTLCSLYSLFLSCLATLLLYSWKINIAIDYSSDKYVQMALKALAMEGLP